MKIALLVAYDGTDFHGFARQKHARTVQGELESRLSLLLRAPVETVGAGRTDAGVHAAGQVVSFDVSREIDPAWVQMRLNKLLAPEVVVRTAAKVPDDFSARFSATRRAYEYRLYRSPVPDPFRDRFALWVPGPLSLSKMRAAARALIGEHDFSSFCRLPEPDVSLVRNVHDARWVDLGDGLLRFDIEAGAFCHQMVRSLVGTMVDIGRGRKRAGDMAAIIRATDRAAASQPAPPHGLCLWEVVY